MTASLFVLGLDDLKFLNLFLDMFSLFLDLVCSDSGRSSLLSVYVSSLTWTGFCLSALHCHQCCCFLFDLAAA